MDLVCVACEWHTDIGGEATTTTTTTVGETTIAATPSHVSGNLWMKLLLSLNRDLGAPSWSCCCCWGVLRVVRWGLAEVFVGRRRVQTDVISRDCFHEVGEKGKNLRLEKCRKMNQNKSRLVLVSFYFIFNFFFFFVFTVPRSRLESTALRHDIRRRSIALIGVKCHVKSSSDDSTRKKKTKIIPSLRLNKSGKRFRDDLTY
jgi:hypothetical protein